MSYRIQIELLMSIKTENHHLRGHVSCMFYLDKVLKSHICMSTTRRRKLQLNLNLIFYSYFSPIQL